MLLYDLCPFVLLSESMSVCAYMDVHICVCSEFIDVSLSNWLGWCVTDSCVLINTQQLSWS